MTGPERLAALERAVRELSEIYDAVQVVGTWLGEDGHTHSQKRGSGNWYARLALCQEFIDEGRDEGLAEQIASKLEPGDESESENE